MLEKMCVRCIVHLQVELQTLISLECFHQAFLDFDMIVFHNHRGHLQVGEQRTGAHGTQLHFLVQHKSGDNAKAVWPMFLAVKVEGQAQPVLYKYRMAPHESLDVCLQTCHRKLSLCICQRGSSSSQDTRGKGGKGGKGGGKGGTCPDYVAPIKAQLANTPCEDDTLIVPNLGVRRKKS